MSADIRQYLIERFSADAATLRARAETLRAATKPSPGPDAALSLAMANACDEVTKLAEQLPQNASLEEIVAALQAMLPILANHANCSAAAAAPAIRSVYIGASTRVQELIAAEMGTQHNGETTDTDNADDDE